MNAITKQEREGTMFGVNGRFFGIVSASNGRILNQTFKASRNIFPGDRCWLTVELRFDDECNNGHETFSITATEYEKGRDVAGGCMHERIAEVFPEFAPLIKWHLVSTDGPMHYTANTMYHADEHGPTYAWVYHFGSGDPLGIEGAKERLVGYVKADKAKEAEGKPGYRVEWDQKTVKVANFDHARSTAVWPDATVEQLRDKAALQDRLPALLADFHADMVAAGFEWPQRIAEAA